MRTGAAIECRMNNDAIIELCQTEIPDIIYLSIGCAQGYYEPGSPRESSQQYPPCIAGLGGRQICILVDPRLESPIRALPIPTPTEAPILHDKNVSFIPVRRFFEWDSNEDQRFIDALCRLAITQKTRLIVQDYTGHDIHPDYPIDRFDRDALCRKVLFDFTYNEGGCFVDLSKVHILIRSDGSFLQPKLEPLSSMPSEYIEPIMRQRHNIMWSYVKRLHRIHTDAEETRDWCTPAIVLDRMTPICKAYRAPIATDTASLEKLLLLYLLDLCICAGEPLTEEDALRIVRAPGKDYQDTVELLKNVLLQ